MDLTSMRLRLEGVLRQVEGKRYSIRRVSSRTGFHAETVRRWLLGGADPKVAFLIRVCEVYGINAEFLLLGVEPVFTHRESRQRLRDKLQSFVDITLAEYDEIMGVDTGKHAACHDRESSKPNATEDGSLTPMPEVHICQASTRTQKVSTKRAGPD